MRIVALESSGLVASVAVMEDDVLIAEYTIEHKKTHSQTLLPMLDEALRLAEVDIKTIDAVAVSQGPGSFTGLRIGSATAKGIGLALKVPLIPVSTLAAMAYNLYNCRGLVCPIMDARRQQVYTGIYRFEKGELVTVTEPKACAVTELLEELNRLGEEVTFLGDGVQVFSSVIETQAEVPVVFSPAHAGKQRASSVAALGMALYKKGVSQSAAEHAPVYLRISQAERERAARLKAKETAD